MCSYLIDLICCPLSWFMMYDVWCVTCNVWCVKCDVWCAAVTLRYTIHYPLDQLISSSYHYSNDTGASTVLHDLNVGDKEQFHDSIIALLHNSWAEKKEGREKRRKREERKEVACFTIVSNILWMTAMVAISQTLHYSPQCSSLFQHHFQDHIPPVHVMIGFCSVLLWI